MKRAAMQSKRKSNWSSSRRKTTALYLRNRDIVRRRDDGCCIRCLTLENRIVGGRECDHFIPESKGGSDELSNLWYLCIACHRLKTQRESNGMSGFNERIGLDGWPLVEPDWLEIIKERNEKFYSNKGF